MGKKPENVALLFSTKVSVMHIGKVFIDPELQNEEKKQSKKSIVTAKGFCNPSALKAGSLERNLRFLITKFHRFSKTSFKKSFLKRLLFQ